MSSGAQKLAVLGSPISHSQSPAIHTAAYRALGLDWEYSAIDVKSGELESFLAARDSQWRGLSLTMPLKREILPLLDEQDAVTRQVGAANTVLLKDGRAFGFNTDVYGAERMLREAVTGTLHHAHILGSGATACSVAVALARCGVQKLTVATRSPSRSTELVDVAQRLGLSVTVAGLESDPRMPDVVVSTLPGDAEFSVSLPKALRSSVPLVDIAYDPWPTSVATHWLNAGGGVVNSGLGMLLYQALAQVRIFVGGDPALELPSEHTVLAAMRAAAFGTT